MPDVEPVEVDAEPVAAVAGLIQERFYHHIRTAHP
jgi:hypothetical protein